MTTKSLENKVESGVKKINLTYVNNYETPSIVKEDIDYLFEKNYCVNKIETKEKTYIFSYKYKCL